MTCADLRLKLHGLVDGELDAAELAIVNAHLGSCHGCAEELETLRALHQAVAGEARYHAAPEGLAQKLAEKLREHSAESNETVSRPAFRVIGARLPRQWMGLAASLLAVAVLSAGLTYYFTAGHFTGGGAEAGLEQELVAGHVRSLMADHLVDVASSDQHNVKPWFNGKLDVAPPVRDLADSGFPLVGGRLDYIHGHAVAALVYKRGQHTINVFIWPDAKAAHMEPKTAEYQGYHLVHWTGPGIVCWAVSDVDPHDLDQLQSLLVW